MSEVISTNKDPAIKLFGHTIQFPHFHSYSAKEHQQEYKDECDDCKDENEPLIAEELEDQNHIPEKSDIITESPSYNDCSTAKTSKGEDGQGETSDSPEKILKKPDKILPCPRCNSMETKFCYFNNYNVSQPRHFCKNCQRYWTAGGTMRNVPVGAGRRRSKNAAFHYRHIAVSETVPNAKTDFRNGTKQASLKLNGSILTFDTDKTLRESMASVLNVADKTMQNCSDNGFHKYEELRLPVTSDAGDNGDDHSEGSSVTAVSSKDCGNKGGNCNSFAPNLPYFTGAPWPYPWSSVHWSNAVPPPGYCLPGFPMSFYPATTYLGCTIPGSWTVPRMSPPTPSQNQVSPASGPDTPTLGKHSRNENMLELTGSEKELHKENNPEKCLWFPKTLRIDDPGDAAKSSIWATLGIKHDVVDSASGGLLKPLLPKSDEGNHVSENSSVLQANPAAMSRSLNFNESS